MSNDTDPTDLPMRARIGYVLKRARVKQGELSPAFVFWLLERKGLLEDRGGYDGTDPEKLCGLIADVMEHSSEVAYDG